MVVLSLMTATVRRTIHADNHGARAADTKQIAIANYLQWQIERNYFDKVAKGAQRKLAALGKRKLTKAVARDIRKAEALLEAAKVKPLAGRLPVNHKYAGKAVPADKLPRGYKTKGLRFTEDGFPDFGPHAIKLPNGKPSVKIKLTGRHNTDILLANKAAGFRPAKTPDGFTWHHHQDGTTMQLVPKDLHKSIRHTGGTAHYKHSTGDKTVYPQ